MPAPKIVQTPINKLHPWPENPRTITTERLEDLKRALDADPGMLDVRPLVALPDGTVIMGNQRLLAARELGWEKVPCVRADVDEQTARLWALRDNQAYGDWEREGLQRLLRDLDGVTIDMSLTGFDEGELEQLLNPDKLAPKPKDDTHVEQYGVIVICKSAQHQEEVYDLLASSDSDVAVRLAAVEVKVVNT